MYQTHLSSHSSKFSVIGPFLSWCYLCLGLLFMLGNQHPKAIPSYPPFPPFYSPLFPATHSVPLPGSPIPFPSLLEADVPSRREPTPPSKPDSLKLASAFSLSSSSSAQQGQSLQVQSFCKWLNRPQCLFSLGF